MSDDLNPPNAMTVAELEAKKQERLAANRGMNERLRSTRGLDLDARGVIPKDDSPAPQTSPFADISTETLKEDLIRLSDAGLGKGDAAKAIDRELRERFGQRAGGMHGGQHHVEGDKSISMNDEIRRRAGRHVDSFS